MNKGDLHAGKGSPRVIFCRDCPINRDFERSLMNAHIAYIGFGSNLEKPAVQIKTAFAELENLPDVYLLQCSSLYRTKPVGYHDQPDFINAAAKIETALTPQDLLAELLKIELSHHRVRGSKRNGSRTLDLDILLYDNSVISLPGLIIPHPRLTERQFVLLPLYEISPDLVFPNQVSIQQALLSCQDSTSKPVLAEEV